VRAGAAYHCVKRDTLDGPERPDWVVRSPDRQWDAYVRKFNVWIRRVGPGARDSIQLTTDGEAELPYGLRSPPAPSDDPDTRKPSLVWSPDSKKIAALRIDERGVRKIPVYSSTGLAPKLFQYPMAYPIDSIVADVRDSRGRPGAEDQRPDRPGRSRCSMWGA